MGSNKDQMEDVTGNSPKGVPEKRKYGRRATKHKKAKNKKKSSKNKYLKSDLCYRSTSSSLLTENSSPSPKKHKSRRKKRKHHKHSSFSSYSSLLFSSSESSETRSVVGTLGR